MADTRTTTIRQDAQQAIGQVEYYPCFADKAAAMAFQLIKVHPLLDGNKRVGYVCPLEFVYRNGYEWSRPPNDGVERELLFCLEPETGVEPATCCLQDSCSAELSYSGGRLPLMAAGPWYSGLGGASGGTAGLWPPVSRR